MCEDDRAVEVTDQDCGHQGASEDGELVPAAATNNDVEQQKQMQIEE